MFWQSTADYRDIGVIYICIGVDSHFHPTFSGRDIGALFEVLCVGLNIMNLKLFDAYRIINSQILVVTLEYLGDSRVVDAYHMVLF